MELYEQKWKQYLLTEEQRNVLLVVDDNRDPTNTKVKSYIDAFLPDAAKTLPVVWVKSNQELRSWINANGTPKAISFDKMRKRKGEQDGLEAARYFVDYIGQENLDLPLLGIHSGSPEGRDELAKIFNDYRAGGDVAEPEVKPDTKPTTPTSTEPRPIPSTDEPEEEPVAIPADEPEIDEPETDIDEPETEPEDIETDEEDS